MAKRTQATSIDKEVRQKVFERDEGCIFCRAGMKSPYTSRQFNQCMHFIPRSKGGLGIEENLAEGCPYHHRLLDQSTSRKEMLPIFESYLKNCYENWEETRKVYEKYIL